MIIISSISFLENNKVYNIIACLHCAKLLVSLKITKFINIQGDPYKIITGY